MALNRGLVLRHVMGSPRFAEGSEARQRLLAELPDDTRALVGGPLLSASWYDEKHAVALSRAVAQALSLGEDAAIIRFFREQQVLAYSRVYKMILPFMKPATLLQRAPWFWRRQHDTGDMSVDVAEAGHATGRVLGNPNACDEVYSLVIVGGIEATVSLTGATGVYGRREIKGPEDVRFEVWWD